MDKYRKYMCYLTVIFIILFIFTVSSCTYKQYNMEIPTENVNQTASQTKIRFISSWGGVDSKAETLKDILLKFEKENKDVKVINDSLFGEDFLPKIKTDFASGNKPDVFGLWPGSDIKALVEAGNVADLTEIMNNDIEWKQSFNSTMWDYTTYNGHIYGLPVEIIFECLFINKDLFDKHEVVPPRTYNDLKKAVAVFKEKGIIPIAFNTMSEGTYLYQNIIASIGGKKDTENPFKNGNIKSCYIKAMKYMKELYDLGAFPSNCFSITNNERNALFREKKAAMIVQGSWFIGDFAPDDKSVDIMPIPLIKKSGSSGNTIIYGLGDGVFHISSSTVKDILKFNASLRLLKMLTSKESAVEFASQTGMISNVNIEKYNINYGKLAIKGRDMLLRATQLVGPPDSFVDRAVWERDIADQFPYFLEGKISAEKIWTNAASNGIIPGQH